jgi:hypothetical protein
MEWLRMLRWSGSDRAVRRKPVVRSGQDVSVYGFSMAGIGGVVAEKHHRRRAGSWRVGMREG